MISHYLIIMLISYLLGLYIGFKKFNIYKEPDYKLIKRIKYYELM